MLSSSGAGGLVTVLVLDQGRGAAVVVAEDAERLADTWEKPRRR